MIRSRHSLNWALLLVFSLGVFLSVPAYGQVSGGTIQGTITDESGAVIPRVEGSCKLPASERYGRAVGMPARRVMT